MKKVLIAAGAVALLSGCIMTGRGGITSVVVLNTGLPGESFVDNNVQPVKVGKAKASGIICFCEGDASIKAAMDNGGITRVHHIDYENKNILGIIGETTTIVYGE